MRFFKNVLSQLHSFVLWALLSAIFWGWIFTLVTDAPIQRKITVYCQVPAIRETDMAVELEERKPEGMKLIQVHSFEYVKFNTQALDYGDVFIIPASRIGDYAEELAPVEGVYGVKVYDAATGQGCARAYITYGDEDYYLFLGAGSVHLEDGKALEVAKHILELRD